MNVNMVRDTSICDRLAPVRKIYNELLSDPRLHRWHYKSCAMHRAKIKELKTIKGWGAFAQSISTV